MQYNATRRVVLAGADAVVFVADSNRPMAKENLAAFENMKVNLLANRLVPEKVPLVFQYNKQDLASLIPRQELDQSLNPWGRKAFPAVAARGDGVMETFMAVVQDMLSAIAVKYNLKEKGLDPEAVPAIVAQAFAEIARKAPPRPPAPSAPPAAAASASPAKVIIAEPEGVEPAYPGQVGPEVNPVSEELLNRAIRANVELAQALGQLVRDVGDGLSTIQAHVGRLAAPRDEAQRASVTAAIETEVRRLQQRAARHRTAQRLPPRLRARSGPAADAADPAARDDGAGTASASRRRRARRRRRPPPPAARSPACRPPAASPSCGRGARTRRRPRPSRPAAAASLDGLVADVVQAMRAALAARPVSVEIRIARGAALPRCSPTSLRRALAGLFQGLAAVVAPQSAIVLRAEKKPVLLRGKDGGEMKRDFLMVAATHAGGLAEPDQQRILRGADTGPFGETQRLVREMGGFIRFAPLPGGALETRVFLPA